MKVARDIIRPTLILVIIALVVSGVVTIVYNVTRVPESEGFPPDVLVAATEIMGTDQFNPVTTGVFTEQVKSLATTEDGQYAINVTSKGYGGVINLVVGLDQSGVIKGVKIVSAVETPGIGTNVTEGNFVDRFVGLSGEVAVGKNVDAVAGATVSSKAVVAGVNEAITAFETAKGEVQ